MKKGKYKTQLALEELMKLAEENFLSAKKIAAQIPTKQLDLEYLINCKKSDNEKIHKLADILICRIPLKQIDLKYLLNCQKSDSPKVRYTVARLLLGNFPDKISPGYLIEYQKLGSFVSKGLINKATKQALTNVPDQFNLRHLIGINRESSDLAVQEIAANLALDLPVNQLDIKFLANYSYLEYEPHACHKELVSDLVEKYEKAGLSQKEEDFINRHFSQSQRSRWWQF